MANFKAGVALREGTLLAEGALSSGARREGTLRGMGGVDWIGMSEGDDDADDAPGNGDKLSLGRDDDEVDEEARAGLRIGFSAREGSD